MQCEVTPAFRKDDVEIIEKQRSYQGFLKIDKYLLRIRRYEGGWSTAFHREVLLRHPGVGLLLYDPDQDKVLLVEQFRAGCLDDDKNGPWALELVAGMVDKEGETAEAVAIREAHEEAGVDVGKLLWICKYYNSPGGSNEQLSIYCAGFDANIAGGIFGVDAEHENIRTMVLGRNEAMAAIQSGRINNAMSIIALQWLELNLQSVVRELRQQGVK
jgi:ADP-ribose pyrophosphatase